MSTKFLQVKWIFLVFTVVGSVNCYWVSLMSVSFFLSYGNFRTWTACFLILCNFQTAVLLAVATLLLLIALPMVSCRRRNALRIEELDEDLSAKDYDHGKRDNGMNAHSSDPCNTTFNALKEALEKECRCINFNERVLCQEAMGIDNCQCSYWGDYKCGDCEKESVNRDRLPL